MKIRVIGLLIFVALLVAIPWLLLRNPRSRKIRELREASRFFEEAGDTSTAQRINQRILELVPESLHDRIWEARLLVQQGGESALRRALAIYDDVAEHPGRRLQSVHFLRARIFLMLREFEHAGSVARSVVDLQPFEAHVFLGRVAEERSDLPGAHAMYSRALEEFAEEDLERVEAHSALAGVFEAQLDRVLRVVETLGQETRSGQPAEPGAAETKEAELRQRVREHLRRAFRLLRSSPARPDSRDLVWGAMIQVARRLAEHRFPEDKEFPLFDVATILQDRLREPAGEEPLSPLLAARIAGLYISTARRDGAELAEDSRQRVEGMCREAVDLALGALGGRSPEAARELLASPPEPPTVDAEAVPDPAAAKAFRNWRDHVLALLILASECLPSAGAGLGADEPTSSEGVRLEAELGRLELPRRVADAIEVGDSDTSRVFRLLRGWARFRRGETERASSDLAAYLESVAPEDRPAVLLRLASRVLAIAEQPSLALEYYDRAEASSPDPFWALGSRIQLLSRVARSEEHRADASRRIDRIVERAREASSEASAEEVLRLARLLPGLGSDQAEMEQETISVLESAVARLPAERGIRRELAARLHEWGMRQWGPDRAQPSAEAVATFRTVLEHRLVLYRQAPLESASELERLGALYRALAGTLGGSEWFEAIVARAFEVEDEEDARWIAELLAGIFSRDPEAAASHAATPPPADLPHADLIAFLRGEAILEAIPLRLHSTASGTDDVETGGDAAAEVRRLLADARGVFAEHAGYLPNRVQLAQLDLQSMDRREDVPAKLLAEIEALGRESGLRHHGHWLQALASLHRLQRVLSGEAGEGSGDEELTTRAAAQAALRRAIQAEPRLTRAYLALARSLVSSLARTPAAGPRSTTSGSARAAQFEAASNLLRCAPWPDLRVLRDLSEYEREAGHPARGRRLLEAIVLLRPSPGAFYRLAARYLADGEASELVALLGTADGDGTAAGARGDQAAGAEILELCEAAEPLPLKVRILLDVVRELEREGEEDGEGAAAPRARLVDGWPHAVRARLETLPLHEGQRHFFLGLAEEQLLGQAASTDRTGIERHRARAVEHFERARAVYERAGKKPPLALLNNLAWRLAHSEEKAHRERAVLVAEEALRLSRERGLLSPQMLDTHAWALFRGGRVSEAEAAYRELVAEHPSRTCRYHLAEVLFSRGQLRQALDAVESALDGIGRFAERDAAVELRTRILRAYRKSREGGGTGPGPGTEDT